MGLLWTIVNGRKCSKMHLKKRARCSAADSKRRECIALVVGDSSSVHFPEELLKYTQRKEIGIADIKVNFLVNYGWEWDLSAIRKEGMEQENDVMTQIHSKDISRIDLVIRWGNMRRLSGMLPVQSVYADFYVVENLWPDYKERDFDKAIRWYDKQDVTLGG